VATTDQVRAYWNTHIHDLEITRDPVGSRGSFDDLDQYHFERISWLNALSKLMKVGLEHDDAPALEKFGLGEFRRVLSGFADVRTVPERLPVKSRLHGGWKGAAYNTLFVGAFNSLPRAMVRRFGWHLLAFCRR
jgi:hypothetical protein